MIQSSGKRISVYAAIIVFILVTTPNVLGKHDDDVVVLKNGDRVTGEIKGLQRGELRIKANYMAEAVRLDWARVDRIESKSRYMIWLVDGTRFTDIMRMLPSTSNDVSNFVIGTTNLGVSVRQMDVMRITPLESRFFKQLEGSIDFGLSYTSGNDQYSTELVATTTYRTGSHSFTTSLDSAFTGQPQGDSTRRNQFTFDYRKQLNPRWFAGGLFDLLSSDQQSLSLRTTVGGLIGRNMKQSEYTRLSVFGGIAGTRERYAVLLGQPENSNADAIAGLDFSTFRFKTTDIRSRFIVFPSLTTPGRTRLQLTSDLRIKLVGDLYWGFHLYENFDSKPPVRADKNDLGVSTSLGWKF
jgi:hypothetical protein